MGHVVRVILEEITRSVKKNLSIVFKLCHNLPKSFKKRGNAGRGTPKTNRTISLEGRVRLVGRTREARFGIAFDSSAGLKLARRGGKYSPDAWRSLPGNAALGRIYLF